MSDILFYSLKSKEVQKELKISGCDLMHLREHGNLKFSKVGNAYLYNKQDVIKIKAEQKKSK